MTFSVVDLTSDLIRFPSVSDVTNVDVADFISDCLEHLGFQIEQSSYQDGNGTRKLNLVARRGSGSGGLAYFAHNDVVPAINWSRDPFDPWVEGDRLYGRGSCDMKGPLATMLCAAGRIEPSHQKAPLWIVVTADEEVGFLGAKQIVAASESYRQMTEEQPVSIIGEPTELHVVHAHKGITGFELTSVGKAAHSSTRDGVNATLPMIAMLSELREIYDLTEGDPTLMDNRFDPPTLSWNIGLAGGDSAKNVTPALCKAWVSLRTMPNIDGLQLIRRVKDKADELDLSYRESAGGGPFWIDPSSDFVQEMLAITQTQDPLTVCYGTDGGVLTALQDRVVCGPGNIAQAHTVNEWIAMSQLDLGVQTYEKAIRHWCC